MADPTETGDKKSISEFLDELRELGKSMSEDIRTWVKERVDASDYDTRLAIAAWTIQNVLEHAREGGSYRYLIYDRLGFGPDAYAVLQFHGALDVSNDFDYEKMEEIERVVREQKIEALKPALFLCDAPDCYQNAGCIWHEGPEKASRHTCADHYEGKLSKSEAELPIEGEK